MHPILFLHIIFLQLFDPANIPLLRRPPPPGIHEDSIPKTEPPHGNPCVVTLRVTDPSTPTRCPTWPSSVILRGLWARIPPSLQGLTRTGKMWELQGRYGCSRYQGSERGRGMMASGPRGLLRMGVCALSPFGPLCKGWLS